MRRAQVVRASGRNSLRGFFVRQFAEAAGFHGPAAAQAPRKLLTPKRFHAAAPPSFKPDEVAHPLFVYVIRCRDTFRQPVFFALKHAIIDILNAEPLCQAARSDFVFRRAFTVRQGMRYRPSARLFGNHLQDEEVVQVRPPVAGVLTVFDHANVQSQAER